MSEPTEQQDEHCGSGSELSGLVMEPIRDDESGHCSSKCPYLKSWDHPFWHHTAWCWKQMKDLGWYDYWLADCIDHEPDMRLATVRDNGRTKAP